MKQQDYKNLNNEWNDNLTLEISKNFSHYFL